MSTLRGIIDKGIVNAEIQFERMGYISTNISNYNTYGYKSVRFEQMLGENGYLSGVERTNFSQGGIQRTSNQFNVAIDGAGFIPVTSPTGDVTYTREGSFKVDKDGYLITNDGYLVGDGIQLPVNYDNLVINAGGDVEVISKDGTKREYLGNIPLVNFQNPEALKKADNNKYYLTAESGEPILLKEHKKFKQGNIELTNMDIITEVDSLIRLNASMLASFKVMTVANEMYSQALQINQ
ncbi:MAG: flagellar hook basal-body protein [Candidatus Gastranaerophilales bacterium]|nr:flagellar hook basal-body protein [Candidatus Gastranaerophilales bacterium]